MKSQQSDQIVRTSCKQCNFAVYENKTQTECKAGRLNFFRDQGLLTEAYDDDKEFFVIERLCNMYTEQNKTVEQMAQDSAVSFYVILDCTDINEDSYQQVLDKIENLQYPNSKIKYHIIHAELKDVASTRSIWNLSKKIQCKITQYYNKDICISDIIDKDDKSFHCVVNLNDFEISSFSKVNRMINEEMARGIVWKIGNTFFVSNLAYKITAIMFIDNVVAKEKRYYRVLDDVITTAKNRELYYEI